MGIEPDLIWYATTHLAVIPSSGGEARLLTPPHGARDLHDAGIGEELCEIAAHRAGGRRIGRAEVDE